MIVQIVKAVRSLFLALSESGLGPIEFGIGGGSLLRGRIRVLSAE
jgi:hypothetical protein